MANIYLALNCSRDLKGNLVRVMSVSTLDQKMLLSTQKKKIKIKSSKKILYAAVSYLKKKNFNLFNRVFNTKLDYSLVK